MHNEELNRFLFAKWHSSEQLKNRWAEHITNMKQTRNKHAYPNFVGKSEGNRPLRIYRRNCEDTVGTNIRQIK
jgi:hypothetical protein